MERYTRFLLKHRVQVIILFVAAAAVCAVLSGLVGVNYKFADYLPEEAASTRAIEVMEEEYRQAVPNMRVLVYDVSIPEALEYKDRLKTAEGVQEVSWLDDAVNIYEPLEMAPQKTIDEWYKDGNALFSVTVDEEKEEEAVAAVREIIGDENCMAGAAVESVVAASDTAKDVQKIMLLVVPIILLILLITTNSWFEPVLFMITIGIAILINMGTNLIFGTVSFVTNAAGPVLQLAVSMDYSIFLIHAFTRYKKAGMGQTEALRAAIDEALNSIFASSLTTIVGFLVLVFMKFSIGFDMGIVLAKGIVCSLLTVVLFMPAMILRLAKWMDRTAHRPFLPEFDRLSRGIFKMRYVVLAVVAVLTVPAYTAQGMNSYMYGNDSVGAGEGTEVYADEQEIDQIFGRSNMMMALVPSGDNVKEREFADEISDLPYTKSVLSLSQTLPQGVPESFLPESVTGLLHDESGWSRILIYVRSKGESEKAFQYSDEIQSIMKKYYPEESYLVGATPSTQDIKTTITADYSRVNTLSLIGVFVVVMFSFRSVLIPIITMIPIEVAIFINMAVPYIAGETMIFIGYIIVSSIQLGATVDYAILTTNNYIACRKELDKNAAAVETLKRSIPSILTSGSILTIVGYILYHVSSIAAIGDMGHLIGRGAILSMILVCTLMPALLVLGDRILMNSELDMIREFFRKRRERRGFGRKKTAAAHRAG